LQEVAQDVSSCTAQLPSW